MTAWRHNDIEFKRILARNNDTSNEFDAVENTRQELIHHLETTAYYGNLQRGILRRLAFAETFFSFNMVLNEVYDYCDSEGIWLGFMPTYEEAVK